MVRSMLCVILTRAEQRRNYLPVFKIMGIILRRFVMGVHLGLNKEGQ